MENSGTVTNTKTAVLNRSRLYNRLLSFTHIEVLQSLLSKLKCW